jgi:signal transduction histidine kinase
MLENLKRKKVLIAEDSPTQALKLQMTLEENDFEVLHGLNGQQALDLIDVDNPPCIIITDIVMPEMNGYELCKAVKQNEKTRDIPVILLTQLSDPKDVIKGLQCGADNFISKPYSNDFLFERIKDILLNQEIRKRSPNLDIAMQIYFGGEKYLLNSNRMQILDLLLSTYYNAINKNKELEEKNLELKKLHKEANIRNIQLKKLNDEKNQFLGIAAHDLRSPLATLSGFLSIIIDALPKDSIEEQDQIFSAMDKMLDYMLSLINDVLDFSKIEAGTLHLVKEDFNLIELMDNIIELSNILGSKKNIHISSTYSKDEIRVTADRNKIRQVMDNIISNAIKFSEKNTEVFVNIIESNNEIEIVVKDNGKGIPENEMDKMFKPFTRTSVESTDGEKSTGLGLATVKKIVETHNGKIWVNSTVGQGTDIHFTLPHTI